MTYSWLWGCLIAGVLLLTGCSEDLSEQPEPESEQTSTLTLSSVTRTDGAVTLTGVSSPDIHIFLATKDELVQDDGVFQYNSGWDSNISVKEETQYYLYGYMPADVATANVAATSTDLNGDYSKGADLTLTGLPAITSQDICLLVGVQRVTGEPASATVSEGKYGYRAGIKGQNYVNVLMDHLYSKLQFSFSIDAEYAELRSIHLKDVTVSSTFGQVNVTKKIRAGHGLDHTGSFQPLFENGGAGVQHTVRLLSSDEDLMKVLDKTLATSADPVLSLDKAVYCAPCVFDVNGTYLTITCKYDVYDRENGADKNNLGERTAVNKIMINGSDMMPGLTKTLKLTVKPTYLYILSDWDSPTMVVE